MLFSLGGNASSPFGGSTQPAAANLFGAPQNNTNLFGSSQAPPTQSVFGSKPSAPATAANVFGGTTQTTSNVFGGGVSTSSATMGGLGGTFGATTPSGGGFGQTSAAATTGGFGSSAGGAFGAQPNQGVAATGFGNSSSGGLGQTIFGRGVVAQPASSTTSSVVSTPVSETAPLPALPEQPRTSIYTPLSELTTEERAQFESPRFTLGKIPTKPPPRELIA